MIDECNKRIAKARNKVQLYDCTNSSESTKELDVMSCTREQRKITPSLIKALDEYQRICSSNYKSWSMDIKI